MSNKMTKTKFNSYKNEIESLRKEIDVLIIRQKKARDHNDIRENSDYETVTGELNLARANLKRITDLVNDAEIVENDTSIRFTIGSKIQVTAVDIQGNAIEDTMELTYDTAGDTEIEKILGANSPLGRLINNGTDGIYTVPVKGGMHYHVKKII